MRTSHKGREKTQEYSQTSSEPSQSQHHNISIIILHSVDSMASRGMLLLSSCILRPCHFGRCHALQAPAGHQPLKPKGHIVPCLDPMRGWFLISAGQRLSYNMLEGVFHQFAQLPKRHELQVSRLQFNLYNGTLIHDSINEASSL